MTTTTTRTLPRSIARRPLRDRGLALAAYALEVERVREDVLPLLRRGGAVPVGCFADVVFAELQAAQFGFGLPSDIERAIGPRRRARRDAS